jgi:hypothetical protein
MLSPDFCLGFLLGILAALIIFYLGVVFLGITTGRDAEVNHLMPSNFIRRAYTKTERIKPRVPVEKGEEPDQTDIGEVQWGSKDG